jgi:hypothetical protein
MTYLELVRFRDKPTGDQLVLMVAGTVCFSIIASGAGVALITIFNPGTDVTIWVTRITGILNTMVGLLAGFLAGRTDATISARQQQLLNTPDEPGS